MVETFQIPEKTLPGGGKMQYFGFGTFAIDEARGTELICSAVKHGIRHFDTATVYANFHILEPAFKEVFKQGLCKREELFIVSKNWCTDQKEVKKSVLGSLKDLSLEYLDLLLVHWPFAYKVNQDGSKELEFVSRESVWRQFEDIVDEGLVKYIGVSNFNCILLYDTLCWNRIKPVCNQTELQIYYQQPHLVKFCLDNDILPVASSPLGNNYLQSLINNVQFNAFEEPVINEIAKKHAATPAQVMLSWNIQRGVAVIPKTSSLQRIPENLKSVQLKLDEEDVKRIQTLDRDMKIQESHKEYFFPCFR